MADSIPSLRRRLAEAQAEIAALRASAVNPAEVVRYERVETVRTEYVVDPAQERTIRELQEALRECQSYQLGS